MDLPERGLPGTWVIVEMGGLGRKGHTPTQTFLSLQTFHPPGSKHQAPACPARWPHTSLPVYSSPGFLDSHPPGSPAAHLTPCLLKEAAKPGSTSPQSPTKRELSPVVPGPCSLASEPPSISQGTARRAWSPAVGRGFHPGLCSALLEPDDLWAIIFLLILPSKWPPGPDESPTPLLQAAALPGPGGPRIPCCHWFLSAGFRGVQFL